MSESWQRNVGLAPVAAIVATVGAVGLAPQDVFAQKPGQNTSSIIAKGDYGLKFAPNETAKSEDFVAFDPTDKLKGKPYILVQGYHGCQFCSKISQNLAKIRKALDDAGKRDIPIVVINVKPESDAAKVKDYAQSYVDVGACAKMEDFGNKFLIVFPKDRDAAVKLQEDIEASFNRKDANSHGLKISVVDGKGVCTTAALGTVEGDKSTRLVNSITEALGAGRGK